MKQQGAQTRPQYNSVHTRRLNNETGLRRTTSCADATHKQNMTLTIYSLH